jgi:hypothetical protein
VVLCGGGIAHVNAYQRPKPEGGKCESILTFGYGCHMEPFQEKKFQLYEMKCSVKE